MLSNPHGAQDARGVQGAGPKFRSPGKPHPTGQTSDQVTKECSARHHTLYCRLPGSQKGQVATEN